MWDVLWISALFGCFSGLLAGLFGIGGGLVLVPFLVLLLEWQGVNAELVMLMAVATSLASIIVTSLAAVLMHYRLGAVIGFYVRWLTVGMLLGAIVGAWLADYLLADGLRLLFAVYMLIVALQMAGQVSPRSTGGRCVPQSWLLALAGVGIGALSALLGIGGGTLTVPLLARYLPMRNAVAISSACGLPIAFAGTISYAVLGLDVQDLPVGTVGYVYMPAFVGVVLSSLLAAPVGAVWANRLPTQQLKRYFSVLLFVVAGKLLWSFVY